MSKFFSTSQVAELLGVSRIAIFQKIKSGEIKAAKIGRNYVINQDDLGDLFKKGISPSRKKTIDKAIKKTITEYGEALKKLKDE